MPAQARSRCELHKTKWFGGRGIDYFPHIHAQTLAHHRQFIDKPDVDHAEGVLEQFCHFSGFRRTDRVYRFDRALIPYRSHLTTSFGDTAHDLRRIDGRKIFSARVNAFGRKCKKPIFTNSDWGFCTQFWKKELPRGAWISG